MTVEKICKKRGITDLLHFTQIENLSSILQNGLLTRSYMDLKKIPYVFNDENRYDGFPNSISLSITFPNRKMFDNIRKKIDTKWAVVICDAKILSIPGCIIYCYSNAAKEIIREIKPKPKQVDALENMFSENHENRIGLKDNETTDVQAEVLYFKKIDIKYIKEVIFDNEAEKIKYQPLYPGISMDYQHPDEGVFSYR